MYSFFIPRDYAFDLITGWNRTTSVYKGPGIFSAVFGRLYWQKRHVPRPEAEIAALTYLTSNEELDEDDHPTIEDELEVKGPEQSGEGKKVRRIRKGRHAKYAVKLILLIREKFIWRLTPRTAANMACVHTYAVKLMVEHGLRDHDRHRILDFEHIVSRFFVGFRSDIALRELENTYTNSVIAELYTDRYVHHPLLRVFGRPPRQVLDPAPQ